MRHRRGKIGTAGHSTIIEKLDQFIQELANWPEIGGIQLGRIRSRRGQNRMSGTLTFRATRWHEINGRITGIKCHATYGSSLQEVTLTSPNLSALKQRLENEGLCAGW